MYTTFEYARRIYVWIKPRGIDARHEAPCRDSHLAVPKNKGKLAAGMACPHHAMAQDVRAQTIFLPSPLAFCENHVFGVLRRASSCFVACLMLSLFLLRLPALLRLLTCWLSDNFTRLPNARQFRLLMEHAFHSVILLLGSSYQRNLCIASRPFCPAGNIAGRDLHAFAFGGT